MTIFIQHHTTGFSSIPVQFVSHRPRFGLSPHFFLILRSLYKRKPKANAPIIAPRTINTYPIVLMLHVLETLSEPMLTESTFTQSDGTCVVKRLLTVVVEISPW